MFRQSFCNKIDIKISQIKFQYMHIETPCNFSHVLRIEFLKKIIFCL